MTDKKLGRAARSILAHSLFDVYDRYSVELQDETIPENQTEAFETVLELVHEICEFCGVDIDEKGFPTMYIREKELEMRKM